MGIIGWLKKRIVYPVDQWRYKAEANGLPIPPAYLNYLVTGHRVIPWYVKAGKWGYEAIVECLARQQVDTGKFRAILDFGCGSGRVIRYWTGRPFEVHGSDYNPDMIRWCRKKLRFAHFRTNRLEPPLDYPAGSFDLVYALSVFTHLDEPNQAAWMAELYRVLRPGGYLFVTVQGDCKLYTDMLEPAELERFRRGGAVVKNQALEGQNACMAFHPYEYVEKTLARGFDLREFVPQGARGNPPQDSYLLRKPVAAKQRKAA